jgi:hypothetical protein
LLDHDNLLERIVKHLSMVDLHGSRKQP